MATAVDTEIGYGGSLSNLVQRIVDGEAAAEAALLERFRPGVHALVRRHCRPGDPIVDDIAHDILLTLLERVRTGAIKDPEALPAYVRTSIVRACNAEYRQRREQPLGDSADEVVDEITPHNDPQQRYDAEQLRVAVNELLLELTVERDRELLRRFYLLEHDKQDVCAALGIDEGHFHRVVHRARQRFRELLERSGIDHDDD